MIKIIIIKKDTHTQKYWSINLTSQKKHIKREREKEGCCYYYDNDEWQCACFFVFVLMIERVCKVFTIMNILQNKEWHITKWQHVP